MNRSQRRSYARTHRSVPFDLGELNSMLFNRQARRSCSDCGGSDLLWLEPDALAVVVPRDSVRSALDLVEQAGGPGAEAWFCQGCANFGVMGSWVRS